MKKNLLIGVATAIGAGVCVKLGYKKIVKDCYEFRLSEDCRSIDKFYEHTCDYKNFKASVEPWVESQIGLCKIHEPDSTERREYIEKLMSYAEERIQHKQWLGCENDFKVEKLEHPEYVLKQVEKIQELREKFIVESKPFEGMINKIWATAVVSEECLTSSEKIALLNFMHEVITDYLACLDKLNLAMEV